VHAGARARAGQSLVELAVALPVLLLLVCGTWGLAMTFRAKIGLEATAREAARAGALAASDATAQAAGAARGQAVAGLYGLGPGQELSVTIALPEGFARGGSVRADVSALIDLRAVPFLSPLRLRLATGHTERIDRWRSFGP
jgi:Flp pilus assembly protein TadG